MKVMPTMANIAAVSPALARHTTDTLLEGVWARPQMTARDRCVVTVAALIARNQMSALPFYARLCIENDVTPAELSELITHLAFYAGWPNATAAAEAVKPMFDELGIGIDQVPTATVALLPINEGAEKVRADRVDEHFGTTAPGVVQYTTDVIFRELWLRPGLAPRDRSLVTVSALVANGQSAQVPYHLNRALDNGLVKEEASEMLTHLAFYVGWPNVFSAMPVFKDVLSNRPS